MTDTPLTTSALTALFADGQAPGSITPQMVRNFVASYDVMRSAVVYVKDAPYNATGDGVTDDTAAVISAISAAGHGRVFFSSGTYVINQTLAIKHPVCLEGPSGTEEVSIENYPAVLKFADNIVGVFIHRYNTNSGTTGVPVMEAPTTTGGDGAILRNLKLTVGGGGVPAAGDGVSHGIYSKTRFLAQDVRISGFKGNGINIVGTAGSGAAATEGAPNNWNVVRCRIVNNGGHGLFTDGADSNAGYAEKIDASSNLSWGIYDSSFLGNTYVACHTAANFAPYRTDGLNGSSVFLGCYSESDQSGSLLVAPTLVIGGSHGAGFITAKTAPHIDATNNILRVDAGVKSTMTASGRLVDATLGGSAVNGDFLLLSDSSYGPNSWRLHMSGADINWDYANAGAFIAYKITGPSTALQGGRGSALSHALATDRLAIGSGGGLRRLTASNAAPTAGDWAIGDVVFNNATSIGTLVGWACTTAGTPGTWSQFGHVAVDSAAPSYTSLAVSDGSALGPSFRMSSDKSLGFYRSGASTLAQSFGTFNLADGGVRLSMRTLAASSVTGSAANTNVAANEVVFTIGGASGASLCISSGGTTYIFASSTSAKNT